MSFNYFDYLYFSVQHSMFKFLTWNFQFYRASPNSAIAPLSYTILFDRGRDFSNVKTECGDKNSTMWKVMCRRSPPALEDPLMLLLIRFLFQTAPSFPAAFYWKRRVFSESSVWIQKQGTMPKGLFSIQSHRRSTLRNGNSEQSTTAPTNDKTWSPHFSIATRKRRFPSSIMGWGAVIPIPDRREGKGCLTGERQEFSFHVACMLLAFNVGGWKEIDPERVEEGESRCEKRVLLIYGDGTDWLTGLSGGLVCGARDSARARLGILTFFGLYKRSGYIWASVYVHWIRSLLTW